MMVFDIYMLASFSFARILSDDNGAPVIDVHRGWESSVWEVRVGFLIDKFG